MNRTKETNVSVTVLACLCEFRYEQTYTEIKSVAVRKPEKKIT